MLIDCRAISSFLGRQSDPCSITEAGQRVLIYLGISSVAYYPNQFDAVSVLSVWLVFAVSCGFTPVCTTELMAFAKMANEFKTNGSELLGLSIDSNPSHIGWSRTMERYSWKDIKNPKINFPIIADNFGNIARLYGMLMPAASAARTVRSVFIIDPNSTIRAILAYPVSAGRSIKEIMRLLLALQAYDKTGNATPADWNPGESQVMPAPKTLVEAEQRMKDKKNGSDSILDWYISFAEKSKQEPAIQFVRPEMKTPEKKTDHSDGSNLDMSGIIRMMGADAILPQQSQKQPSSNMTASRLSPSSVFSAALPSVSAPSGAAKTQKQAASKSSKKQSPKTTYQPSAAPYSFGGGIMEQNRLLFPSDDKFGLNRDYMITRDFPNNGK